MDKIESTPATPAEGPVPEPGPALDLDVASRCQDEKYRQGYAKGYSNAIGSQVCDRGNHGALQILAGTICGSVGPVQLRLL